LILDANGESNGLKDFALEAIPIGAHKLDGFPRGRVVPSHRLLAPMAHAIELRYSGLNQKTVSKLIRGKATIKE
jgi:hypothetical protein